MLAPGTYASWVWSADGAEIVYTSGHRGPAETSIRAVTVASGATRTVVAPFPGGRVISKGHLSLSTDGQYVYFLVAPNADPPTNEWALADLYRVRVQSGAAPELVASGIEYIHSSGMAYAVSPGGDLVAVQTRIARVLLVRVQTGERTVVEVPGGGSLDLLAWSPTGRGLLVVANAWFSWLDVPARAWSFWDAQSVAGAFPDIVATRTTRWEGENPVVYAVRYPSQGDGPAVASRYDVAARVRQDLGTVLDAGSGRGYAWSPTLTHVGWSHSRCVRTEPFGTGSVCTGSMYELHVVSVPGGESSNVVSEVIEGWPDGANLAFAAGGERIAYSTEAMGLRVYEVPGM